MRQKYVPEQGFEGKKFIERMQTLMVDNKELDIEGTGRRFDELTYFANATSCVINIYNDSIDVIARNSDNIRRTIGYLEEKSGIRLNLE